MKCKLLVLDVDETLLNDEEEITPRTLATLLKAQQVDVHLVSASGRPTYETLPLAKELGLDNYGGYIVSYNDAQVINAKDGEVLFEQRVNPEMLPYLEKEARRNGFSIFAYTEGRTIADYTNSEHIPQEAHLNGMELIGKPEFSAAIDFAPSKCMLVNDDEEALVVLEEHWKKCLSGALDVSRSKPYFLEVSPCGIDKLTSLGTLLSHLGITPEETIVTGDDVCDVLMMQFAGLGIAMGNAQDSVKVCTDVVIASDEEDGVTLAVEKAILAEVRLAEIPLDQLNGRARHASIGNLGIQYTYASKDRVEATMSVGGRARQPFGILHGGATLALAETVAGLGSVVLCQPDEIIVGMQVNSNHMSSAHEGDTMRAVGIITHKDRSSHVWNVGVLTPTDKLVSSTRTMNSILKKR